MIAGMKMFRYFLTTVLMICDLKHFNTILAFFVTFGLDDSKYRKSDASSSDIFHKKIFIMATSSSENTMSINDLPLEDFLEVFNYISLDEAVTSCSNVCVQWKEAIALHIVAPKIPGLARSNLEFKTFLEKKGWNQESNDVEKILSFYHISNIYNLVDISNFFSSK